MERGRERVNRLPTCYLGWAGNLQPAGLGGEQDPEGLQLIEEQGPRMLSGRKREAEPAETG